jgi:hypothetical protein
LAFIGAVTGFFVNIQGHFHHNAQRDSEMAVAQSQTRQADYQASVQSYANILKAEPSITRRSTSNSRSPSCGLKPGQDPGITVAAQLDQIIAILDAALARTNGAAAADVQAHIGWAHWLNQHVAQREYWAALPDLIRASCTASPGPSFIPVRTGGNCAQTWPISTETVSRRCLSG